MIDKEKYGNHLKHLLFKDATMTHSIYTCEEFHALELADIITTGSVEHHGGYWDSLEDIEEYVNHYASDERLNYLLENQLS